MRYLFLLILPLYLIAQNYEQEPPPPPPPHVSPQKVQQQLNEAEQQFNRAVKLFNPWYTGPLITPSATMVPPGQMMWQPYIYFTDNYAQFNEKRESVDAPNEFIINPQPIVVQIGVTPSVDTTIIFGALAQWKEDRFSGGAQDLVLQLGFLINKQTLYVPKSKFTVSQSFPTGAYKNLNPRNLGLDGTGAGCWGTTFSLTFGKVMFWDTLHPLNTRISFGYKINTPVKVTNFNSYGGGFGTRGVVHPGPAFNVDLGLEVSINQPWVAALDIVYNFQQRTPFHGRAGTTTKGGSIPAATGGVYNDQLSLAPALEYNFNDSMGILWGVWFTVWGRSAPNFVSGIFSWYWVFGL